MTLATLAARRWNGFGLWASAVVWALFACALGAIARQDDGLPTGPTWGRGNFQPKAANTLFASGDGCCAVPYASPKAAALWSPTGEDVSPHGLWRATLMAHSAKDPYWKAQVSKEVARSGGQAADVQALASGVMRRRGTTRI